MYTNQIVRVSWSDYTSSTFKVSNGVKQGGVLSPILFAVYIDELLNYLKESKVGCHIGLLFLGALSYADDIILLAPTRKALYKMLSVANEFSDEYNVMFNPDKCKLMVYENNPGVNEPIFFNNTTVQSTPYECHLGNLIGPALKDAQVRQSVSELYGRTNVMLAQFKHAFSFIKYKLFKSFCMSVYGCQLWDFSSPGVNQFFIAWRKCVRMIWNLPYRCHNNLLSSICNDSPVEKQLHKRFLKFVWRAANSNNVCSQVCARLALSGSRSNACKSVNFICHKYTIDKNLMLIKPCPELLSKVSKEEQCDADVCFRVHSIHELIQLREHPQDYNYFLTKEQIEILLEYFCTS
jgi:hypothetical protein